MKGWYDYFNGGLCPPCSWLACWLLPSAQSVLGSELVPTTGEQPWWAQRRSGLLNTLSALVLNSLEQGCVLPANALRRRGWKISDILRRPESRARWFWGLWVLAEASAEVRAQTHVGPACKTRAQLTLTGTISSFVKYWIPIRTATRRIAKSHRLLKEISKVNLSFLTAAS